MNEIVNDMNLSKIEKKVKFYQTYLFKLVTSSITIISLVISGFFFTTRYIVDKSVKDVRKTITDSLQDIAIKEKGESIGEVYKYIEKINEKTNILKQDQEKTDKKVDNVINTISFYFNKVDKSMNLLLQQRNSELKIDTLKNQFIFGNKNNYENPLKYVLFINN